MIRLVLILLTLIVSGIASGQSRTKFLEQVVDSGASSNSYITDLDYKVFLANSLVDQKLTLSTIDEALLSAIIFHMVNEKRGKKGLKVLQYCTRMQNLADQHTDYYSSRKFENTEDRNTYLTRNIEKMKAIAKLDYGLVDFALAHPYAVEFNGKKEFYYWKKGDTELKLYYGQRPALKDSLKTKTPVEECTYREFATRVVKEYFRKANKNRTANKGYEYAACSVRLDSKTLNRKKIPKASCILVLGGFKTRLINSALQPDEF